MVRLSKYRSKKARARHARVLVFKTVFFFLLGLFFLGGVVTLLLHPAFRVRDIGVAGNEASALEERVRAVATRSMEEKLFFVFPKSNTFLFPVRHLREALLREMPELARAEVRHSGFREIQITVFPREPFALWCGDIVPLPTDPLGDCYTLDQEGVLFAHGNILDASSTPVYFYGVLDRGEPLGATFLNSVRFAHINNFIMLLNGEGFPVGISVTLDEKQGELHLQSGARVLYLEADTPETLVRRFSLLMRSGEVRDTTPLEYIDLRFGKKVYVKYQDAGTSASSDSVSE